MMTAHVAGAPIEELIYLLAPAGGVLAGVMRLGLRALSRSDSDSPTNRTGSVSGTVVSQKSRKATSSYQLNGEVGSDLGRCECQHDRQGQKHRAHVVVPVGVNLLLRQLDVPSRQDLVALEALANTG